MAVTVTCYGAVNEIGGNKILLEDDDTRLLLDFGTAFGRVEQYYNEFLRPRPARGVLDPLMLGLIPPLRGLYRRDLGIPRLWDRVGSCAAYRDLTRGDDRVCVDAVLLSHAHLDHNGDVSYLDERIPIHASRLSAFIARSMQVTGVATIERELVYANPRSPGETGELKTESRGSYRLRPYCFLDGELATQQARDFWLTAGTSKTKRMDAASCSAAPQMIGRVEVCWWPVDHSIPGACGFALQTSAGWVGYSGDLRFHGTKAAGTRQFMQELAALKPVALLCEGTHPDLSSRPPLAEAEIADRALRIIKQNQGKLVIADFGPRNLERLLIFLQVAADTNRALLVQPKDIYLLHAMYLADPSQNLAPEAMNGLMMYADPKAAPRGWEVELRQDWQGRIVGPQGVSKAPGDYILADSLWDLNDLPDLEGIDGGAYLFSNSRAYDDEQAADLDRLRAWVRWMGLTLYGDPDDKEAESLHASGHATGSELVDFVRVVCPKVLIPIHTEDATWWQQELDGTGICVHLPEYGHKILI
jgi:ribonuclease J